MRKKICLANIRIAVLVVLYENKCFAPASLLLKAFAPCDSNQYQENSRTESSDQSTNAEKMLLNEAKQVKFVDVKPLRTLGVSTSVGCEWGLKRGCFRLQNS